MQIIKEKQDLTYLKWSHIRNSSGTAGTFLKSESVLGDKKIYYKLSDFEPGKGVVGHECINELIVDRLLTLLDVPHLDYKLINSDIEIDGQTYSTYLCSSFDFKEKNESKAALDDFYRINALPRESAYDFCVRMGWQEHIDRMIAIDYIILNRDRHGANIEVLRNSRAKTLRIAPLFDHGLSLLYSCYSENDIVKYDIDKDLRCNNFIGGSSCLENLNLIKNSKPSFAHRLDEADKIFLFDGLYDVIPDILIDKIWAMIYERFIFYENL